MRDGMDCANSWECGKDYKDAISWSYGLAHGLDQNEMRHEIIDEAIFIVVDYVA